MNCAVIVAAGNSTRFKRDKMLIELNGKPLIMHTINAYFNANIDNIVVVASSNNISEINKLTKNLKNVKVVAGGVTRMQSVTNGLNALPKDCLIVTIADGARPYTSSKLINNCISQAQLQGNAITGITAKDTLYYIDENPVSIDRNKVKIIQTPQAFNYKQIMQAYYHTTNDYTDDSQVYLNHFGTLNFIEGEYSNIKVTYPDDLINIQHQADHHLNNKEYNEPINKPLNALTYRIGNGIDFHNLVSNRKLIIGGVEIPYHLGLDGHSDADVLIHAIMDSLLNSINQRDIGMQFPDNDEKYKNISSLVLLRYVADLLRSHHVQINNISACIIADQPKLSKYIPLMAQQIANALEIDTDRISISATTTEGIGINGNPNSIAAQAYCIVNVTDQDADQT